MPALLLVSPEPLTGKTTIAVGLAQRLSGEGRRLALLRLAGGDHADADAALYAGLAFNSQRVERPVDPAAAMELIKGVDLALLEAPAGDPTDLLNALPNARALVVAGGSAAPEEVSRYAQALADSLAAVVINRVPARRRQALEAAFRTTGLPLLALLPEDRTLAAPTLGQVAEAIKARATFLNASRTRLVDRPLIASISADPAQGYFAAYRPSAVIVRGDKPDLQLAALNAGAPCLILTGGLPPLSYVRDRAEEDYVPVLQTELETVPTVQTIEAMFGATPFAGGAKLDAVAALTADLDLSPLTKTS